MKKIFTLPQLLGRTSQSSASSGWPARKVIALCLAVTILHLSSMAAFAFNEIAPPVPTGEIAAARDVSVNSLPAIVGQTFFSGSVIATPQSSFSTISLSNLSRLELRAETTLRLDFSASGLTASLDTGEARFLVPRDLSANITTINASLATDAREPAVFSVAVEEGATTVSVQAGRVEMRAGESRRIVSAGESLSAGGNSIAEPAATQRSNRRRGGWWLLGAGAVAAIVIVILATRDNDQVTPAPPCVQINVSPSGQTGCL